MSKEQFKVHSLLLVVTLQPPGALTQLHFPPFSPECFMGKSCVSLNKANILYSAGHWHGVTSVWFRYGSKVWVVKLWWKAAREKPQPFFHERGAQASALDEGSLCSPVPLCPLNTSRELFVPPLHKPAMGMEEDCRDLPKGHHCTAQCLAGRGC